MASDEKETVLVERDAATAVATITLNRPAALNALTIPMKLDLAEALRTLGSDPAVGAIVLTGAGRAFCAGQDLRERLEPDAPPLGEEVRDRYNPIIRAMRACPAPIVAAINGVAAGAGASLAFAADVRVAADTASFVLAFNRIGLVPDSGASWFLPRLVGLARASDLALIGDSLNAADAERLGIVRHVVAPDALLETAHSVAARLATNARRANALTKRLLEASFERTLEEALDSEAEAQDEAGATRDHAEGLQAFVNKRAPRFTGE